VSGAGGRASLQTLLDEPDWSLASFLLSVLGEGTFLSLLSFLERSAPDPVTRQVARLALKDEARHVAFGLAHLNRGGRRRPCAPGPAAGRHRAAPRRPRLDLRPGPRRPRRTGRPGRRVVGPGVDRRRLGKVQALQADMDEGRRHRLVRLGSTGREATELSALHTKNFM